MTPGQYRRLLKDIYRERKDIVMKKGVPNGWIMTGDSPSNQNPFSYSEVR